MIRLLSVAIILFGSFNLFAEDLAPGLTNESALGYVVTGGNSESETVNIAQKSQYQWTRDILRFEGSYLQTEGLDQSSGVKAQTAENWKANLRFERVLTPKKFNAFVTYGWLGDRFQGVREGQSADIGAKYYLYNNAEVKLFVEGGYQYRRELLVANAEPGVGVGPRHFPEFHYGRLAAEIEYNHSKTLTLGLKTEYLASIATFSTDHRFNYNPYLTSVLTDLFSLKVSYDSKYRYLPAQAGNKLTDYTFTTSLLAKF